MLDLSTLTVIVEEGVQFDCHFSCGKGSGESRRIRVGRRKSTSIANVFRVEMALQFGAMRSVTS